MAEEAQPKSQQLMVKFQYGFYILMMLTSVDDIYWAEYAAKGHGWALQFTIVVPWICAFMAGMFLLTLSRRRKLDQQLAGNLLFFIAFVVSSAYRAMGKLAFLVH